MKNFFKKAYTLAEVIIVMLIIAVVVSVSIKVTKAKLDNITSYTYYTAYNTVRAVSAEMLKDFNPEEEDYGVTEPPSVALRIKNFFASNFGILPAWASCTGGCSSGYYCSGDVCLPKLNAPDLDKFEDKTVDSCEGALCDVPQTPSKDLGQLEPMQCEETFICANGTWNPILCKCDFDPNQPYPFLPTDPDPDPEPDPAPDPNPINTCPAVTPCGKECNASTGFVLSDISGFSRTCSDAGKQWSEAKCDCIPTPQTVSRNGEGFCRLFVNYTNTARLEEDDECKGDAISTNETDFADKDPDMILRNGMILYNVSQDPEHIALLAGNSKGVKFTDSSGRVIDVDEWGYTLYIDIDGARNGQGRLWEDVYPFYVTLSGTVIPAYDAVNPELSGGDSSLHLQTSVYDEFVDGNGRHIEWITKSRPFKDSACIMGYVNPAAPYCQGVPANAQCAQENHDCRLKTVMPVKFFGH